MTIEGDYTLFAHRSRITSASSRIRTLIATNVRRVVEAARGSRSSSCPRVTTITVSRPVTAMRRTSPAIRIPDRRHRDAQASWSGRPRHRQGAACADRRLRGEHGPRDEVRGVGPDDLNVVVLVDFDDSVRTALEVAHARPRLWGVRLDTSRSRRPLAVERARRVRPARCQRRARVEGAVRARRARVRAGEDRRVGRFRHGGSPPSRRAACRPRAPRRRLGLPARRTTTRATSSSWTASPRGR